jgi:ABC-type branched-subunit amino acid transport system substrate-binding protein
MGQKLPELFEGISDLKAALFITLFFVGLIAVSAQAQDYLADPASGLNIAMGNFQNGEYDLAYNRFLTLAKKYPDDKHNSIFRFMAAKSLYEAGTYGLSDSLWDDFIITFPGSLLLPEAHLFKGHCLYKLGRFYDASSEYLTSIEFDPKSKTAQIANDNFMPLARRGLTIEEQKDLGNNHPASPAIEPLEFEIAKREIDSGHYRRGIVALQAFMRRYPGSREFKQAKLLMDESQGKADKQISIGLLAPTSGGYQEFGRSMIEGARLAMKDYNNDNSKVELIIKDTGSDPIDAAKKALEMTDEEPLAVVGPLSSESAVSAAAIFNEHQIPMITPTASEAGLSSIGPYVFQISSSIEHIGEAVAKYAIKNLKLYNFAIIAPNDDDAIKVSNAFTEAVYRQGGEVIFTSYYPSGATDFKEQIMPLHDILVAKTEAQLAEGAVDSSIIFDPKTHEMLARDEWPVNLDGLFLPGYADGLKMLIPQVRYHVIRTHFLGSDSWDSPALLREVKPYIESAIFGADFHADQNDSGWRKFSDTYKSAYGHVPDKAAATTYDAVRLILDGIEAGNKTPEILRDYLSRIENYKGVSTNITFKETDRANNAVGIYSIDGKRLNK